jgi:putative membrane protein (TIGR04086 family)
MKPRLAEVEWGLVLRAAVLLYVATFILGLVLSFLWLVFLSAVNATSDTAVAAFSLIIALLLVVVTGYGAWRAAREVDREAVLHGFLVGFMVALLSFLLDVLFSRQIQLLGLLVYALMVVAGWLGGVLASRPEP